jgi:hypothetical protein
MRASCGVSLFLALGFLQGCTTFDPLDQTGETVNRNATDYANDATLLNVVRASLFEPLAFITITGLSGTESATGTLGLPGVTFGPHVHTSPHSFTLGPNSVGRTNSNTFQMSVVDDPASFTALLAPVNPAILAFFIRQGYPRAMLFFLFTDELRQVQLKDPKTKMVKSVDAVYVNNPNDSDAYGKFQDKMATLLNEGLTAQIDVTAIPSGHGLPPTKLCIDRYVPAVAFGSLFTGFAQPAAKNLALCDQADWIEAQTGGTSGSSTGGGGTPSGSAGGGLASLGVASDGSIWLDLSAKGAHQILRIDPKGQILPVTIPKDLTPSAPPENSHAIAYQFDDEEGRHYQLFLRSTFGAYEYVGAYWKHPIINLLELDDPKNPRSGSMLTIQRNYEAQGNAATTCFAEVDYRGVHYCVPDSSTNTKQLFKLLHQLQELETAPSNTPTTLTVTSVAGP